MVITASQTSGTYKAQIRTSLANGLKIVYTGTCTMGAKEAAQSVVRKYYGERRADAVREVRDAAEIKELFGDFHLNPQRKQVFYYFTF